MKPILLLPLALSLLTGCGVLAELETVIPDEGLSEAYEQVEALLAPVITTNFDGSQQRQSLGAFVEQAGAGMEAARKQLLEWTGKQEPESSRAAERRAQTLSLLEELMQLKELSSKPLGLSGSGGDKFNELSERLGKQVLQLTGINNNKRLPIIERLLVVLVTLREDAISDSNNDNNNGMEGGRRRETETKGWFARLLDKIFR